MALRTWAHPTQKLHSNVAGGEESGVENKVDVLAIQPDKEKSIVARMVPA